MKENPRKENRQQKLLSMGLGLAIGALVALIIYELGSDSAPGASDLVEHHRSLGIKNMFNRHHFHEGDSHLEGHRETLETNGCPICPECQKCKACPLDGNRRFVGGDEVPVKVAASEVISEKYARNGNPELRVLLESLAINKEVLIAVSNGALINREGTYGMLKTWIDGVHHAGVKNFLVVALDDAVAESCRKNNVEVFRMNPKKLADKQASNHGISSLKFQILREFLILGYNVLLSDVDIVTLQDPFKHLYRDADVESMSDGWEDFRAYGYDDVDDDAAMGWSRYSHSFRIWHYNSGLFYLRASDRTIELMDRITDRLAREQAWDQAIFNEYIWFPSHGDYKGTGVTSRVMDRLKFMNSKTLFKFVRHDPHLRDQPPVMVHVNYHSNKFERMLAIVEKYINGKSNALDRFTLNS